MLLTQELKLITIQQSKASPWEFEGQTPELRIRFNLHFLHLRKLFYPLYCNIGSSQAGYSGEMDCSKSHFEKSQVVFVNDRVLRKIGLPIFYTSKHVFRAGLIFDQSPSLDPKDNESQTQVYISEYFNSERTKKALGPKHQLFDLASRQCNKRYIAKVNETKQYLQNRGIKTFTNMFLEISKDNTCKHIKITFHNSGN